MRQVRGHLTLGIQDRSCQSLKFGVPEELVSLVSLQFPSSQSLSLESHRQAPLVLTVSMRPNAKKAKKRAKLLDRANKQVSDPMTGKLSQGDPVISSAADGENDRDDTGGKRTKALRENCHLGPFDSDATTAEMTAPVRDSRRE